jgi:hypothetical protein
MMQAFRPQFANNGAPGAGQLGHAFLLQRFMAAVKLCAALGRAFGGKFERR